MTDLALTDDASTADPSALERRGRWWLAVSFLFCPCHLPLTRAERGELTCRVPASR